MVGFLVLIMFILLIIALFRNSKKQSTSSFKRISNNYKTVQQVNEALKKSGLESSNLIIGIDFTASNLSQGQKTFRGQNLHDINGMNPYQSVIQIIGRTLESLDEDKIIPAFGYGDSTTKNHSVFPILNDKGAYCVGFEEVLHQYCRLVPTITLSGPTNFAPIIDKAVSIVCSGPRREYHILIIITDGQVCDSDKDETIRAIVNATKYPLSIIVIGVGDGPFDEMEKYDDELPERAFDNFQFVNFHRVMSQVEDGSYEAAFALASMMELPDQYREIQRLSLMKK